MFLVTCSVFRMTSSVLGSPGSRSPSKLSSSGCSSSSLLSSRNRFPSSLTQVGREKELFQPLMACLHLHGCHLPSRCWQGWVEIPRYLTQVEDPHSVCSHSHCLHHCHGVKACSGGWGRGWVSTHSWTRIAHTLSLGTGMQITAWRLPSWEHDSSGEEGVKGTEEADTPFRI